MRTLRLTVDPNDMASEASRNSLETAASILRSGGTVAFPTETVYGLGANALDAGAVTKIFEAKQRPTWDPLIVHVTDSAMLRRVTSGMPENGERLIRVFWPGPLTLLLPRHPDLPSVVTAGRERAGVRIPQHPVAEALIRAAGLPIAAPSANTFGRISPTLAMHVLEDLDGRIDAVLDSGETTHGLESTVVDVCEDPIVVYRPGVITLEQIRAVCVGAVAYEAREDLYLTLPESQPSPGIGLRHYAPRARLVLVDGEGEDQLEAFSQAARTAEAGKATLGLMLPDFFQLSVVGRTAKVYRWGAWSDDEQLAQRLFAGLRYLDLAGCTVIVCPLPAAKGIGVAIRDRLQKAARSGAGASAD
jgi:L-threonylcarbamoyladenylate synthase